MQRGGAQRFSFKDRDSIVWTNVRIGDYNRDHDDHRRWNSEAAFRLIGDGSVGTYEGPPVEVIPEPEPEEGLADLGEMLTDLSEILIDT
jgi:hypothetical protein